MAWGALITAAGSYLASSDASNAAAGAAHASDNASKYSADLQKQEYDQSRSDQLPWLRSGQNSLDSLNYYLGIGPKSKTREQLLADYTPQFTKRPLPSELGTGTGGAATNAVAIKAGLNPFAGPTIDTAGLNQAVDAAMARQASMPQNDYGSLLRNFSQSDLNTDPVYQNGLQFGLSEGEKGINNMAAASGSQLSGATLKALTRYGNDYGTTKAAGSYDRYMNNNTTRFNRLASMAGVGQTAANNLSTAGANYANNASNLFLNNAANQGNALLAGANARGSSYQGMAGALGKADWSKLFSSSGSNGSNNYIDSASSSGIY